MGTKGKTDLSHGGNMWMYRGTYTRPRVTELMESLREWVKKCIEDDSDFLFADWAFSIGMNPSRISYVAELDEDFKEIYQMAKEWQAHKLQKESLYKRTDYRMALMMLCNHHGWKVNNNDDDGLRRLPNAFEDYMAEQKERYKEDKK